MPKLKERPEEKQDRMFAALLAKNMTLSGIAEQKELAKILGVDRRTLSYKLKDPDKFTRKELRQIFRYLNYSDEEKGLVI